VKPNFGGIFDFDRKSEKLEQVNQELEDPTVWNDQKRALELGKEKKALEGVVLTLEKARRSRRLADLFDMGAKKATTTPSKPSKPTPARSRRSSRADGIPPHVQQPDGPRELLHRHPGRRRRHRSPGLGLDADAPVPALLRTQGLQGRGPGTVRRRSRRHQDRTIKVEGEYAYGHLRTETGVHRLVRKSPFDSANGRHTSFTSLFVYPEVDESFEIEINPADVRIDTYRASGAGGQHINKTDSAVRLTHAPSGIVVQCQNDRSQHRNKAEAFDMLRAKLFELEMRKRMSEQQKLEDSKTDVGWGHQIRSYVLDQSRIKDLRTGFETGNTKNVLDGDLDDFISASLKQGV
jgi:peptide chain release factor 2